MFLGPNADADQIGYFDAMQRASASPKTAASYQKTCLEPDVREELARLEVPTLVVHRRGDLVVPYPLGREIAALIPGTKLVGMEGNNHGPSPTETEAFDTMNREFAEFFSGDLEQAHPDPNP